MKSKKYFLFFIAFGISIAIQSCMPSAHYQNVVALPNHEWDYKNQPSFRFEVNDTTAMYNLYFIIRHTDAYPFSNIWLWIHSKAPDQDSFKKTRIEIPLAEKSGKWLGRGMGDIWEQRMPITNNNDAMVFSKKGIYEIKLEQNMRTNPLPEILQIGLRVENAGHKKAAAVK